MSWRELGSPHGLEGLRSIAVRLEADAHGGQISTAEQAQPDAERACNKGSGLTRRRRWEVR